MGFWRCTAKTPVRPMVFMLYRVFNRPRVSIVCLGAFVLVVLGIPDDSHFLRVDIRLSFSLIVSRFTMVATEVLGGFRGDWDSDSPVFYGCCPQPPPVPSFRVWLNLWRGVLLTLDRHLPSTEDPFVQAVRIGGAVGDAMH